MTSHLPHVHRGKQTVGEEIANTVTHGMATGLSISGLILLVVWAGATHDGYKIVSLATFGVSMVLLYLASTLYHAFSLPRVKHVFRIMDHASIYLLIAGTYTPFALVSLRETWGWPLFYTIWAIAAVGVVFKVFFVAHFSVLSTIAYIAMGWLAILAIHPIMAALPMGGLLWVIAGGLCYTSGVVFYAWNRLPFNHAVWHVFVMGGTACHFVAVAAFVLPT